MLFVKSELSPATSLSRAKSLNVDAPETLAEKLFFILNILIVMWGEVSMCDTPPTLIIVQVDLVQHFIKATRITTDNLYW
jgi:hypothetical protein